jgi:DNA-binding transcriptional regulator YiaG
VLHENRIETLTRKYELRNELRTVYDDEAKKNFALRLGVKQSTIAKWERKGEVYRKKPEKNQLRFSK